MQLLAVGAALQNENAWCGVHKIGGELADTLGRSAWNLAKGLESGHWGG